MKIKSIYKIAAAVLMLSFTSCLKDLDTLPLDQNRLVAEDVYSSAEGYEGILAKCYASLIMTGQTGPDGNRDVPNIDEGYSGFTRALFYLQVGATDEIAVHAGGSHGTRDILFMNWDAATRVVSYPYYRLYMTINYCNELLRETTEEKLRERGVYEALANEYEYYRAEARFIRAYCYTAICDLYGSGPFVDEHSIVGENPEQKTRQEIYDYAVAEAEAAANSLKDPKTNVYGRVDKVAAWFLLSRIYLNSQTWVGENQYEKAYQNAKKIVEDGSYPLDGDYRNIFLADNHTSSEIIWPLVQDEDRSPGHAGTNFMVKALVNGVMNNYYPTGVGGRGWGNARVKTQLVNLFDPQDQIFDENDTWGDNKNDKRAQFFTIDHSKETWQPGQAFQNDFNSGYASIKWRNVLKDGTDLDATYTSIDFPMFRTADAYLMAAEAILRGANGSRTEALDYINEIRDRAYLSGNYGSSASGKITDSELTLDFILDERARELHTELVRRTDLIRFNKFTSGYNWDWKGSDGNAGNHVGQDVSEKYKLYPIPQDEFTVNPNLVQNPDYN